MKKNKSELEKKFEQARKLAQQKISAKVDLASKALKEAEDISEKYGIPFSSRISPLSQGYKPTSFETKWAHLFEDMDSYDIEDKYDLCLPEYEGWQHSAVC